VSSPEQDNVIYIAEYLEGKQKPDLTAVRKRLAEIGLEQLILTSERNRLREQLRQAHREE
jgi:hypothetical protein